MVKLKKCNNCGKEFPRSPEYFYRAVTCRDGLRGECKACNAVKYDKAARARKWNKANPNKVADHQRKYRESKKGKQVILARRERNKERKKEYARKWRDEHREQYRKSKRLWQRSNPKKVRANSARRRAREKGLAAEYTDKDFDLGLTYFNGCCAVCNRPLNDLFGDHTAAMDHWIPLSSDDCPGTVLTNIVPLCHGVNGCNNKKGTKEPEEWLIAEFGKRKAREILERIETYFEWVKEQQD